MAGHNRHISGDYKPILVQSPGAVTVEAGDLMYRESAQSNQAYPFKYNSGATLGSSNENKIHINFLGVAMEGKESGVTENITIATDGVFRYPIAGGPSAVTIGALVSAVSHTGLGVGVSNQAVANAAAAGTWSTTAVLGVIQKTESGASFVDFRIYTAAGSGVSLAA